LLFIGETQALLLVVAATLIGFNYVKTKRAIKILIAGRLRKFPTSAFHSLFLLPSTSVFCVPTSDLCLLYFR
jgi:hypothetical protein